MSWVMAASSLNYENRLSSETNNVTVAFSANLLKTYKCIKNNRLSARVSWLIIIFLQKYRKIRFAQQKYKFSQFFEKKLFFLATWSLKSDD